MLHFFWVRKRQLWPFVCLLTQFSSLALKGSFLLARTSLLLPSSHLGSVVLILLVATDQLPNSPHFTLKMEAVCSSENGGI
jgi:hypothetical protein